MFLLDDIFLRSIGLSIPGFDMIWNFEQILNFAYKERAGEIKDRIKENRVLYEFGEMTKEEYESEDVELKRQLRLAERVEDMDLGTRIDILGG